MPEDPYVDPGTGAGQSEAVVLDIGGTIGAVILYAPEEWLGQEIDLTPGGAPRSHHLHALVRRRRAGEGDVVVAVFQEVEEGPYTLWRPDGKALMHVLVSGGAVTEVTAPDA